MARLMRACRRCHCRNGATTRQGAGCFRCASRRKPTSPHTLPLRSGGITMAIVFDAFGIYEYDLDEDEENGYNCCCETCLQNHPERDALYNDSQYYGEEDDADSD